MKISIKTRKGKSFEIEATSSDSINDIKNKISVIKSIPNDEQHLVFDYVTLKDQKKVNDYSIQDGSEILLFNKKNSLLLKSSKIFPNSTLIDRIRQSYIDLKSKPQVQDVINLLIEALSYLDESLDLNTKKELSVLIMSCFSQYPEESFKIYQIKYQKTKLSSYNIILLTSLLSKLANNSKISIDSYNDFLSNIIKEIIPQLHNNNENLKVQGFEIITEFKTMLILNTVLSVKLTEQIVTSFYPFFLSKDTDFSKLNEFIQKVHDNNLLKFIPESAFIENNLFLQISNDNTSNIISIMTEPTFKKILPILDNYIERNSINSKLSNTIMNKCIKLNIKPKSIRILIGLYTEYKSVSIWEYLNKNTCELTDFMIDKILEDQKKGIDYFAKTPLVIKIVESPEKLPQEVISYCLLNSNEIETYYRAFNSRKIECDTLSTIEFWKHFLKVISKTKTLTMMDSFTFYFQKYIKPTEIFNVYDQLIFNNDENLNSKQSSFLYLFLSLLPEEYRIEFHKHDDELNDKLLKTKEIHPVSFLKIFNLSDEKIKLDFNNPFDLYLSIGSKTNIRSIEIKKMTHEPNENLIKFIELNDFDFIKNIDEESLSLIACSLFYTFNMNSVDTKSNDIMIFGLTIENFLPFLAIALNNCQTSFDLSYIPSNLFIDSCNYFIENPSPFLITSVNSIINSSHKFKHYKLQSLYRKLINFFVNGEYKADPFILLLLIYRLTDKSNDQIFNIIVQYIPKIINDERFKNPKLNLIRFNQQTVFNVFVNLIVNATSYEQIIQTITFLESFCVNLPALKFENSSNLNTAFQKALYEENWDDVSLILNFNKKFGVEINDINLYGKKLSYSLMKTIYNIPKINKIDDIITILLSITDLEKHLDLFQSVFLNLMYNLSLSIKYITYCLERYTFQQILSPQNILEKLSYFNLFYPDNLKEAINRSYLYSSEKKQFVRKIDSEPLSYSITNFDFLSRLIQNNSYQSFICLHNIAAYFPFLFEPDTSIEKTHSIVAIELVLPTLNCIPKLFDPEETEENLNNLKRAFAAISFIHSCLYSVKFLSIFVPWLFENFTKLNEAQIYCFSRILDSLFRSDSKISKIVMAYAIKYDFLEIIANLLNRKIPESSFKYHYNQNLIELSNLYFIGFSNIRTSGSRLFIDQIKNDKIKTPFINQFNNFNSIYPIELQQLQFSINNEKNNEFLNKIITFINDINNIQITWILFENDSINDLSINSFLKSFSNNVTKIMKITSLEDFPSRITIDMHRYLLTYPNWKLNFFENYNYQTKHLLQYPDYKNSILGTIKLLKGCDLSKESFSNGINQYTYYATKINSIPFFDAFIKEASNCIQNNNTIISNLISTLNQISNQFSQHFIQYMLTCISDDQITSQKLDRLCQICNIIMKYKKDFVNTFLDDNCEKLINLALMSSFRSNESLIKNISSILKKRNLSQQPKQLTQIIGLIFAIHPKLINNAIDLYNKIDKNESSCLIPVIQMRYIKDADEQNPDFNRIKNIIENIPSLIKDCYPSTKTLLNKVITKYKNENYQNSELQQMIIDIYNGISPDRKMYKINNNRKVTPQTQTDSNEENLLNPVPDYIKQTNPEFWEEFYEKNRSFLNKMIKKHRNVVSDFNFLSDYIELLSFNLRYVIFKNNINNIPRSGYGININVSRSKILLESFGYWCTHDPKDFISGISVNFKNENGSDAGGLTREWLTYLVREIMNPKYGFFVKNENQSYHFNPENYMNELNLEFLKMAGGIIAISLVLKTNVNAHLSTSILRQILHQEIQIDDMKDFDESLYNSFDSIMNSDDVKPLDLVFSIDELQNGSLTSVDLIENGSNTAVTNENKGDYINLYANYKLKKSVSDQLKAFCEGFESIIDFKYIKMFTPNELDIVICGNPIIDIEDMKKNVSYEGKYHLNHPVIVLFYDVISKWSQENLSKLIQFITGSSNVGVNGFEDFRNNGNSVKIASGKSRNHLPIAHTCSNQLILPPYDNEKDMNDKLLLAIHDCHFGFN